MELVYLWVEDYKNIHHQGFNFSPRFECSFDGENLTIDEKKDYVNIFPKNINVTAIVGENGSGKSSILNLILDLDGWASTSKKMIYITSSDVLQIFLVNFASKVECNLELTQKIIDRQSTGIAKYSLSNMGLNISYLSLSPFLQKINNYYSNSTINFLSIFNYVKDYENHAFNFDDFFFSLIPDIPELLNHKFIKSYFSIKNTPNTLVFIINKNIQEHFPDQVKHILKSSDNVENKSNIYVCESNIENLDIVNYLFELHKLIVKKQNAIRQELEENLNADKKKHIPNLQKNSGIDLINLNRGMKNNKIDKKISDLSIELENLTYLDVYFADIYTSTEFHFSTGELVLFFYTKQLLEINSCKNNLILCIDETELFLHPDWQKKFINFLVNLFKESRYRRQILISSHSPFVLSDLPKENVIFLENGEQKEPFGENEQTFGANIHTLLSHGFFMKDGLMGEFAKEKINEIIKNLNNEEYQINQKQKKQLLFTINSIGEDFLKSKLLDMYYKKFDDEHTKKLRKEELLKQQENIKKELENL